MRVVVADDHSLFRDGIISLLEAADFQVVGQVGDGKSAIESVKQLKPDLVLLDIVMPEMDGLEVLQWIKEEMPDTYVVILTVSDDDQDLFTAIEMGADGYLLKDLNAQEFLDILSGVEKGEAAITRKTAARLMSQFKDGSSGGKGDGDTLSSREIDVLSLVGEGLSNRAIAHELYISENTVKYHMRNILQKLGAQNRTEAVAYALRQGLLDVKKDISPR